MQRQILISYYHLLRWMIPDYHFISGFGFILTIITVLHFCKLLCKMLVRPISPSLWYCVKDNVVLQALCPSSNCLYMKSISTVLWPLEGGVGYELFTSKWSNSDSSSSGFLSSNWLNWPFPNSILKLRPRLISHQRASNKAIKILNRCFQSLVAGNN